MAFEIWSGQSLESLCMYSRTHVHRKRADNTSSAYRLRGKNHFEPVIMHAHTMY
jgi:hypothetical protein